MDPSLTMDREAHNTLDILLGPDDSLVREAAMFCVDLGCIGYQ
jgi:hypothetical protein